MNLFMKWRYKRNLKKENRIVIKRYEDKLRELMSEEDFNKFCRTVARELFLAEILRIKNKGFRDFCLQSFRKITKD